MVRVATYYSLKAVLGFRYGLCDEKVIQEVHDRAQNFNVYKLICKNTQKTNTAKKGFRRVFRIEKNALPSMWVLCAFFMPSMYLLCG
jgi:hypothetical protein